MRLTRRHFIASALVLLLSACSDPFATPFAPPTDRPTFVFFYASECALCDTMRPIVDGLKVEYQDRVAFFYLDATGNGKAAIESYQLTGYPSYLLLRQDGSTAWSFLGVRTHAEFAEQIEKILAEKQ